MYLSLFLAPSILLTTTESLTTLQLSFLLRVPKVCFMNLSSKEECFLTLSDWADYRSQWYRLRHIRDICSFYVIVSQLWERCCKFYFDFVWAVAPHWRASVEIINKYEVNLRLYSTPPSSPSPGRVLSVHTTRLHRLWIFYPISIYLDLGLSVEVDITLPIRILKWNRYNLIQRF